MDTFLNNSEFTASTVMNDSSYAGFQDTTVADSNSVENSTMLQESTTGSDDDNNNSMDSALLVALLCFTAGAILVLITIVVILIWCRKSSVSRQKIQRNRSRSEEHIKYLEQYSVKTGGEPDAYTPKVTPHMTTKFSHSDDQKDQHSPPPNGVIKKSTEDSVDCNMNERKTKSNTPEEKINSNHAAKTEKNDNTSSGDRINSSAVLQIETDPANPEDKHDISDLAF